MRPEEYCEHRINVPSSSYYYSFLFLPPERRRAITALYAFCREVDDVVDECTDAQLARAKLAWWRVEIGNLFAGDPQHPVTRALAPAIASFGISAERLNEIIDGMQMDLDQSRYLDFQALEKYCYRVASVAGLIAAEIFGYRDPRTLEYARNLGIALQLTNIIRDVGEDARKNRIYLPMDELKAYGVPASDILNARSSESLSRLLRFQTERAHSYYAAAFAALPEKDRRAQRAGLIMAEIYRELLDEIASDGFQVLTQRISLTPLRKLWIAVRTWLKT